MMHLIFNTLQVMFLDCTGQQGVFSYRYDSYQISQVEDDTDKR